jgi:hypothetical protein
MSTFPLSVLPRNGWTIGEVRCLPHPEPVDPETGSSALAHLAGGVEGVLGGELLLRLPPDPETSVGPNGSDPRTLVRRSGRGGMHLWTLWRRECPGRDPGKFRSFPDYSKTRTSHLYVMNTLSLSLPSPLPQLS